MRDKIRQVEQVLETYRTKLKNPVPKDKPDIYRAVTYINENLFHSSCNVHKMKVQCRLPQNNFSARFKYYMEMSPASYISHHRIEAAKRLLSRERLKKIPVGELGFAVGYNRASTFSSMFTDKIGVPPGRWRNQKFKTKEKTEEEIEK